MAKSNTLTGLKRWSCSNKQLPAVERIKRVHVYDFDNTLFCSPLPNKQLWAPATFGALQTQDYLYTGGWWHNPDVLSATGEGLAKERTRAWEGCWNEKIVELVRMTMADDEAFGVLLTGRGDARFSDLLQQMLKAKGLDFDMVCLKPAVSPHGERFDNTLKFKTALLEDIMTTYNQASEVRMYEDRPKHTKAFRDFFESYNSRLSVDSNARAPFFAEVVQVTEGDSMMDPVQEVAEVQKMINKHNQAILDGKAPAGTPPYKLQRNVILTGYLVSGDDSQRLKSLMQSAVPAHDLSVKWMADSILISARQARRDIIDRVGGMGAKMRWRVVSRGHIDHRVWALRVEPATPGSQIYTETRPACIVMATAQNSKPYEASKIRHWQNVQQHEAFEFDTTVGERALLRIEEERTVDDTADDEDYIPVNNSQPRKHPRDEDFPPLGPSRAMPRNQQRSQGHNQAWGNRPGGIGFASQRGNRNASRGDRRRGGDRRGPPRGGGRGAYRSLDANVGQGYGSSAMEY